MFAAVRFSSGFRLRAGDSVRTTLESGVDLAPRSGAVLVVRVGTSGSVPSCGGRVVLAPVLAIVVSAVAIMDLPSSRGCGTSPFRQVPLGGCRSARRSGFDAADTVRSRVVARVAHAPLSARAPVGLTISLGRAECCASHGADPCARLTVVVAQVGRGCPWIRSGRSSSRPRSGRAGSLLLRVCLRADALDRGSDPQQRPSNDGAAPHQVTSGDPGFVVEIQPAVVAWIHLVHGRSPSPRGRERH